MILRRPLLLRTTAFAVSLLSRRGSPFSVVKPTSSLASSSLSASSLSSSLITTDVTASGAAVSSQNIQIPQSNIDAVHGLEPEPLWRQFAILSSIPRPSKKEDAVINYIQEFATQHNLKTKQDNVGNLVVFHPGSGIGVNAPPIIIQGHVDMVTEKNQDTVHDFDTDPILLRRIVKQTNKKNDGDGSDIDDDSGQDTELWLGATGTTLGSDNGIGVAAALALLETPVSSSVGDSADDDDVVIDMPPIEALFTIDEETGLTGAKQLDVKALGLTSNVMLNLDTEEWENFYVGCSGGGDSVFKLPLSRTSKATATADSTTLMELRLDGLLGGHSGINIHEGRGNAVCLLAATVQKALKEVDGLSLVSFQGGDKRNAIPREASAKILVPSDEHTKSMLQHIVSSQLSALKAEYGTLEKHIALELVESSESDPSPTTSSSSSSSPLPRPLDESSTTKLLSMLLALPVGPLKYSHVINDLVETSNNVASVVMSVNDDNNDEDNCYATVTCSTRSSISSALEATRDRLEAVGRLVGANCDRGEAYPGWSPNPNSELLELGKKILSNQIQSTGRNPGVKAIHAGLECGLLIEKLGGQVDALSFGPTITGAHSPDEMVHVDTVPPFFELVKRMLAELAKKRTTET